jgi:sugar lactone lactonase YvrE
MAITIERIGTTHNELGESAQWHAGENALYWVDCRAPEVFRLDWRTREVKSWRLPARVSVLVPRRGKGALLSIAGQGVCAFDFDSGALSPIVNPEPNQTATEPHDGKVDGRGRFIFGTMDRNIRRPLGSLYRLEPTLECAKIGDGFIATNGPCWSPDWKTFYLSESLPKTILAFDYDLESGSISNRRVFASTADLNAIPDGATVDADGRIWWALFSAGKVACFTPDGKLQRTIDMPEPLVTSVSFGGEKLDVLFVTTIGKEMIGHKPGPDGGALFAVHGLGATGRAEQRFAG